MKMYSDWRFTLASNSASVSVEPGVKKPLRVPTKRLMKVSCHLPTRDVSLTKMIRTQPTQTRRSSKEESVLGEFIDGELWGKQGA